MPDWTTEQKKAIEARGSNILLSAAAGSGKTTVLVERVMQLVQSGTDIDRMLIVTFTRAASADMREKLTQYLTSLAEKQPQFRKQLMLLEHASISTLHAFCSEFLRSNFEAAEVDPAFRLVQESEMSDMVDRALDRAMEDAYTDPSPDMVALNAGRGTAKVREMVRLLLNALNEQPEPEIWLEKVCSQGPDMKKLWADELTNAALVEIRSAVQLLQLALEHPECAENYAIAIARDIERLNNILSLPGPDYDGLRLLLEDFKFTTVRRMAGVPAVGDSPKKYRENAKKKIDKLPIRSIALAPLLEDIDALTPALRALGSIALHARTLIADRKRAMGVLTYNDLEHFAIRALKNDSVAQLMRDRYDYVFVDEYQDTSNLQEYLVSRIVRDNNLFMVGDVKQSIYRFRQAEPTLFREKYDAYAKGNNGALLHLTRNFRSCPAILNFVNCVFEHCMTGGTSEILYDENARLNHGNLSLQGGNVELHILKKPGASSDDNELDDDMLENSEAIQEAVLAAKRIKELKAADGSLDFKDFALLSRAGKGILSTMAMVLTSLGVPAYAEGAESYYESIEVRLAISLLQLVKNRRSDIDLIGILHSPVVGLTVDELARIRVFDNGPSYSDAVQHYATDMNDELSVKLRHFLARLDEWRILSETTDLGYFAHTMFTRAGLYNYARVLPASAQRIANIDRIVSDADAFDHDISGSLTLFMNMLEHRRKNNEVGDVNTLNESDNVVRLMTIHKSKGLEFRVVFGIMLGHKIKMKDTVAPLTIHRELGISCLYTDQKLRSRRKTLSSCAIDARTANENYAEELRILYVMLTRAREQLILIGSDKDPESLLAREWKAAALDRYLYILMAAVPRENNDLCTITAYSNYFRTPRIESTPADEEDRNAVADPMLVEAISWKHIRTAQQELPLKLTVSGILREIHASYAIPAFGDRPLFMRTSAGKLTGTERGTAYHRVLQCLDLHSLKGITNEKQLSSLIAEQIRNMRDMRRIRPVEHDAVDPKSLARFMFSETGKRMLNADVVRREWSFNARMNVADVLTLEERGHWGDGEIMVQGTVDACFLENGSWVLLDYKTDRETDHDALTARYADQLRMYAYALSSATAQPVSEIRLCLLASNETLRIDP